MSSPMETHGGHIVCTSYGSSPLFLGICTDCNQDYLLSLFYSSCLNEESKLSREGDHEQRASQTACHPHGCDASLPEGSPFLNCLCRRNFFKITFWLQHLSRKWCAKIWVLCQSGGYLNALWIKVDLFIYFSESCLQAQQAIKISLVLKSTMSLQDGTHWLHSLHL